MATKMYLLALASCFFFAATGCDNNAESGSLAPLPSVDLDVDIPDDWATISLLKVESGGTVDITLAGRKQTLEDIVKEISHKLSKPINLDAEVDSSRTLDEFEFNVDDGAWTKLLDQIAAAFECVVQESESEFLLTPGK